MLKQNIVREATRLTRAGQLVEATALLQRMHGQQGLHKRPLVVRGAAAVDVAVLHLGRERREGPGVGVHRLHVTMHLSLMVSAGMLWWPVVSPTPALLEREDCTLVAWYRCLRTSRGRGAREGRMTVTIGRRPVSG